VWSHLKRSLANLAKRNLSQLTALIKSRLNRMQYRPGLLDGFLASTRLDLTPFCGLCRRRHNRHYADLRIMPIWRREPLVVALGAAERSA